MRRKDCCCTLGYGYVGDCVRWPNIGVGVEPEAVEAEGADGVLGGGSPAYG